MWNILFILLIVALIFVPLVGYTMNIVKLIGCDFEAPYKSETIRSVGVLVPFVGVVTGYMEFPDGPIKE